MHFCYDRVKPGQNDLEHDTEALMYTVLVCDDDRAILDSIRIYLTQEGYEVLTAMDGIEALELLKEHEVHCMVS